MQATPPNPPNKEGPLLSGLKTQELLGPTSVMLDYLIDIGFAWEEAITLLNMREHLYDNVEMLQRMADDHRIQFARWLYAHGEISEY